MPKDTKHIVCRLPQNYTKKDDKYKKGKLKKLCRFLIGNGDAILQEKSDSLHISAGTPIFIRDKKKEKGNDEEGYNYDNIYEASFEEKRNLGIIYEELGNLGQPGDKKYILSLENIATRDDVILFIQTTMSGHNGGTSSHKKPNNISFLTFQESETQNQEPSKEIKQITIEETGLFGTKVPSEQTEADGKKTKKDTLPKGYAQPAIIVVGIAAVSLLLILKKRKSGKKE
ncbi:MAG: hypothetical protein AAF335_05155 [Bacteroidota bacterium]